ncbi:MAG TPA: hypothetical protein VF635_16440 [Propionibacteriaceae bacterium]|jgi:hypothetical protein
MHVRQHGYGCPTPVAPYGKADPTARRTKECCRVSGCLDLFHDLLVASSTRLSRIAEGEAGARARDPRRYAYVVVTRLLVDLTREQRVRAGYPARPGRLDGEARRVVDALEAQDPECAGWLITLFRMIRDYAHKQGRVASSWPYDGWAAEKTHYVGNRQHPVTRDEVRSDIAAILETARSTLGAAWVYTNVYQPLRSASGSETLNEAFLPTATEDLDILLLSIWLRQAYVRARRGGMATSEAFKLAATLVTGLEAPALTAEIRISLRDLEQDLAVAA